MEKRDLICVSCPIGCAITVELDDNGQVISVTGNTCKRGDSYARQECTHPERMLTSTVKVEGGRLPVVPVKSSDPVRKVMLFAGKCAITKVNGKEQGKFGDVVLKNILNTGADIVATNEV